MYILGFTLYNIILKSLLVYYMSPCSNIEYNRLSCIYNENYDLPNINIQRNKFFLLDYFYNFYVKYCTNHNFHKIVIVTTNQSITFKSNIIYSSNLNIFYQNYFNYYFFSLFQSFKILCKKIRIITITIGKLVIYITINFMLKQIKTKFF